MKGWGANLGADLRPRKGALLGVVLSCTAWRRLLCEDFWPPTDQVSDAENAELTLPFSPEVGQAIASMKACSAPGPDGLPVMFFQRFWETMRPVIMPMFQEFYIGTLDMGRINFGVVALIPKVVGASDIRQFRPITVINVLARIFAKGDGGLWLQLIEAKYLQGRPLFACSLMTGSQFWKSIQGIKDEIRLAIRFSVGNGAGTQFWLDPWLDGEPLRLRFPRLSAICGDPAVLVSATAREDGWHVAFRCPLGPAEVHEWEALQVSVPFPTSSDRDSVAWSLSPSGEFSVSSAYLALCRLPVLPWLSPLWKAPLPLKIKIFVWQLLRDRLFSGTEPDLGRRGHKASADDARFHHSPARQSVENWSFSTPSSPRLALSPLAVAQIRLRPPVSQRLSHAAARAAASSGHRSFPDPKSPSSVSFHARRLFDGLPQGTK
ncbi:Heparanase-like protein 2 [Hordeum vulgare]|nr:Heparanase-like protein 2 [Hordeum vulgare]